MPKIGKYYCKIKGELEEGSIFYTRRLGFELRGIGIIEELKKLTDFSNSYNTEHELTQNFNKYLAEYHEIIKKIEKVIRIDVRIGYSMEWTEDEFGRSRYGKGELGTIDIRHGIGFEWAILFKKTLDGATYYKVNIDSDGIETIGYREYVRESEAGIIIVPYDEKIIRFLENMAESATKMSKLFMEFFTSEDVEQKLLTGNTKLLS